MLMTSTQLLPQTNRSLTQLLRLYCINTSLANPLLIKATTWPSIHLCCNQPLSILAQCHSHPSSTFLSPSLILFPLISLFFRPQKSEKRRSSRDYQMPISPLVPVSLWFCCFSSSACSPYLFIPLSLIFIFPPSNHSLALSINAFCFAFILPSPTLMCSLPLLKVALQH